MFGLTLPVAQDIKEATEKEMTRLFPDIQSVCRYRREGIYQYVKQQEDTLVIMEEFLQGRDSYPVEELQQLADLGNNRIIFLMDHSHAGDDYVKALYCCGIYDGLYLDEAAAKGVMELVQHGRTNEQARNYYGIQTLRDAEKEGNVVNEERLGAYLEYLEAEAGSGDLGEKYRFVSTRLGTEENRVLAASLAGEVAGQLRGNEVFEFYRGASKGKRPFFFRGKKAGKDQEAPVQQEVTKTLEAPIQQEETKPLTPAKVQENIPGNEDEIFGAIDRFWALGNNKAAEFEPDQEQADLLVMLGGYLKIIDI